MDRLSALPPLGRLRAFEAAARLENFTSAALSDIAFEAVRLRGVTQSNELVLPCQL